MLPRAVILHLLLAGTATPALRPLMPADLFQIEKLGEVAPSPDGKRLAYVHIRGSGCVPLWSTA
jgi:hypothetical protein